MRIEYVHGMDAHPPLFLSQKFAEIPIVLGKGSEKHLRGPHAQGVQQRQRLRVILSHKQRRRGYARPHHFKSFFPIFFQTSSYHNSPQLSTPDRLFFPAFLKFYTFAPQQRKPFYTNTFTFGRERNDGVGRCPSAKKEAKLRCFSVPAFFSSFLPSFPISAPSVFLSVPVFYGFSYKFSFAYS